MCDKGLSHTASQPLDLPDSPVGFHCLNVPAWVSNPPIEAAVFGWGASEDHQLGLDIEEDIESPKVVEALLGIKFMGRSFYGCPLVGGSRNTLAIDAEGGLWSWGWNDRGTLGHGHRDLQRKPACVEALAGVRIVQAAIGGWHCLALTDQGQVYCWGGNEYQQCGLVAPDEQPVEGSQAAAAQAAAAKAAAAAAAGSQGSHSTEGLLAAAAAAVAKAAGLHGNGHATNGSAAAEAAEVVSKNGNDVEQSYGVLPTARDILVPRRCMPGLVVRQVACGGMNSVVLTEGGEVWTWGEPWGEFALELQRAPRKVPGAHNIAAIACGAFHNMALVADGRVLTWGTNDYGQLGNGSTIYSTTPVEVVDLEEVAIADIAAGGWHSMALTADGQIYVWGRGEYGRLGIADRTGSSKLRPHKVRGLEGHTVVQVAAGGTHSLAVTSTGRMFIWGRASYGRLGLGPGAKDQYAPVEAQLPGGHERWKIAAATAGGRHTMCLAVPVRDATLRGRDADAASSRGPSRAASVQGEPQAGLLQRQQQQLLQGQGTGASTPEGHRGPAVLSSDGTRTPGSELEAAIHHTAHQQQQSSAARGPSSLSRDGSSTAAAGSGHAGSGSSAVTGAPSNRSTQDNMSTSGFAAAATAPSTGNSPRQQQQQLPHIKSGPAALNSGGNNSSAGASLPALGHALSTASSYSFAPSPGSSILGGGSPSRSGGGDAALLFSPMHRGASQQMGVEAIHAATAAAAAAAHLGPIRVASPAPGGSSGWSISNTGSTAGLKAGEQAPLSPRCIPPPMSPSQRRADMHFSSLLDSEPGPVRDPGGMLGAAAQDDQAAADDAMQRQEYQEQREQDEMERDIMQQRGTSAAAATAAVGLDPQQQQQQLPARPGSSGPAADTAAVRMMRRSGSHQGLSALPPRPGGAAAVQASSSPRGDSPSITPHHMPAAGILHALSGRMIDSSSSSSPQGGSMAQVGQMSRQQSAQLAAAVASSHGRVDASRAASAASLPSLTTGVGLGPGSSLRMGHPVARVDSDMSQEGLAGLGAEEGLDGGSPTGSSGGKGGASPTGSTGSVGGLDMLGTSPPGGVYDVSLGDSMARYTNSLPEREFIHYNTHLS